MTVSPTSTLLNAQLIASRPEKPALARPAAPAPVATTKAVASDRIELSDEAQARLNAGADRRDRGQAGDTARLNREAPRAGERPPAPPGSAIDITA